MKLLQYLNCTQDELDSIIRERFVEAHFHDEFPLVQLTYGRRTVFDNGWTPITCKTRGLIYNSQTGDVVARPFEKFFNLGTGYRPETQLENLPKTTPNIMEKLDGSLAIMYRYNGTDYIASKGSFNSIHAKWSTDWYHKNIGTSGHWPKGFTPVFEMICPDINRIVVSYDFQALVLLALIDNETGEELNYRDLCNWAAQNDVQVAKRFALTLQQANRRTLLDKTSEIEEGYVAVWDRPGEAPFRVKMKYTEYLRLHRLVSSISPKHVLECMRDGLVELDEYLNNSTPWFKEFVTHWKQKLQEAYLDELGACTEIYYSARPLGFTTRKEWALLFTKPENRKYAPALFHMLDQRQDLADKAIFKLLEPMVKYETPMITEIE